jgi:hypothetical protein
MANDGGPLRQSCVRYCNFFGRYMVVGQLRFITATFIVGCGQKF